MNPTRGPVNYKSKSQEQLEGNVVWSVNGYGELLFDTLYGQTYGELTCIVAADIENYLTITTPWALYRDYVTSASIAEGKTIGVSSTYGVRRNIYMNSLNPVSLKSNSGLIAALTETSARSLKPTLQSFPWVTA